MQRRFSVPSPKSVGYFAEESAALARPPEPRGPRLLARSRSCTPGPPARGRIVARALLVLAALLPETQTHGQSAAPGSIRGTAVLESGTVAPNIEVFLVDLKRRTRTDAQGAFAFDAVPPGKYLVEAISPRFGTGVASLRVEPGVATVVTVRMDLAVHHEDVVTSAGISAQSVSDVAQSVQVLDDRELAGKAEPTLGATLSKELGVSATGYAPGASRPILRGLGGDRIRVLQDAIGVGDVSSVSPDHAVTFSPFAAERVEVVRGAATLLYGSNAIGGVVNVLDGRIPDHRTDRAVAGDVLLRYGSNAESNAAAASLGGTAGFFGWHADYATSDSGDYAAGGPFGVKPNSDVAVDSGSVGVSWLGDGAYAGAGFNRYETNYGSAVEETVRVDMEQQRWDLLAGRATPFGPFRSFKVRIGGSDYEHVELEAGAIGTRFLSQGGEGRVELAHAALGPWLGSFGAQGWSRKIEAIGDEAFLEPADSKGAALFVFEELGAGALTGQFGLRYEAQSVASSDPGLRDRDFDAPSASAGLRFKPGDDYSMVGTVSYSSRVPTVEELYSNGPHIATGSFEVGDPDLDLETALGVDVGVRRLTGRIRGELNVFASRFSDYVFELDTGATVEIEPGEFLPVLQFTASRATFWGGEAHVDFSLIHAEPHHLDLEARVDYVRAELSELDQPVPLQPPLRTALGLKYQGRAFWAHIEGLRAHEQDRFGANDTATPAHTLLNAELGYRLLAARLVHDFILRGVNLTDELAYASTSRYRFDVPLPGIDVTVTYRLTF